MISADMQKKFSSYTYGEARTGMGQLVKFSCPTEFKDKIINFFRDHLREVDLPTTGVFNISHGGYGRYTRYNMTQHDYAGGGSGFIEVLEIRNAPDQRCSFIVYQYHCYGKSDFTEWETLEDARNAWNRHWSSLDNTVNFPKAKGFKRWVECGALAPWFYAIGDEELVGDYALPYGLENDPAYRIGRKFVIFDDENVPYIKTCMGTRFVSKKKDDYPYEAVNYRIVYWHDGSSWNESHYESKNHPLPRELKNEELWITEAIQQFQEALAGKRTDFVINFTDRYKFIGKVVEIDKKITSPEGDYLLVVTFKDKRKKKQEGWVNDFTPTSETPDIIQYVTKKLKEKGHEAEHIEIKSIKAKKGGKKWCGMFFSR